MASSARRPPPPHPLHTPGGPGCHGSVSADGSDRIVDDGVHAPLDIYERVGQILQRGYTVVPDFLAPDEVASIRHAFDTEVPITTMAAIGTETGKTLRAHNLLAKTRACDFVFLDPRVRARADNSKGAGAHRRGSLRPSSDLGKVP
jgi:hypothetical protein